MIDAELRQLRIPGPAPVPPRVFRAASRPMVNHRGKAFKELLHRLSPRLKALFDTEAEVLVLTGSGSSGMEAAVVNHISPGDSVLVLVGGKFGERWAEIADAFGAKVETFPYAWGEGVDVAALSAHLSAHPDIRAIFATHNESSTSVLNDIEAISRARTEAAPEALLIVDSVSGLGGAPYHMDDWGVDVTVTGSQKCLMLPPGLALVAQNDRATARMKESEAPRYYFDLERFRKSLVKGETPWTPAVSLVQALEEALDMLDEEGIENVFRRHRLMRDMVRAGVRGMGLTPFVEDRFASPTVTAVKGPQGLDLEAFRVRLRDDFGVIASGGQGELAGHIFRVGHMGFASPLEMLGAIAAIELALAACGHSVTLGAGVSAAQKVWAAWA